MSDIPRYDAMRAAVDACYEYVLANIDGMSREEAQRLVSIKPERMLCAIRLRATARVRGLALSEPPELESARALVDALLRHDQELSALRLSEALADYVDPDAEMDGQARERMTEALSLLANRWLAELSPDPEHEAARLQRAGVPGEVIGQVFARRSALLENDLEARATPAHQRGS